jgi:hypothetical protein
MGRRRRRGSRRGPDSGGGAVEEWRSSGKQCEMERRLGAAYIGWRKKGRRRARRWRGVGGACAINAGGLGARRFRGRGRCEAVVGEWGRALMARWRRRTGAGRPGSRGRPAAARPVEGERELEVWDGPDGWGPPTSCCERGRGSWAEGGELGREISWAVRVRWVGESGPRHGK